MVHLALGPSQHCVVVGQDHAARRLIIEPAAIHPPDACDHAVRRCPFGKFLNRMLLTPRRQDQRAVLSKRTGITDIFYVLSRRPLPGFAPPSHSLWPLRVLCQSLPLVDLRQVGSNRIKVNFLRRIGFAYFNSRLLDKSERLTCEHCIAFRGGESEQIAAHIGSYHMLHLHRLQNQDLLSLLDGAPLLNRETDDRPQHGCQHWQRTIWRNRHFGCVFRFR